MILNSKFQILEILSSSKKEEIYSVWNFISGLGVNKFYIVFNGSLAVRQELSFLLKEPMINNPVCIFRNGALTIKGQEWADPITFYKREKR